MERWLLIIPRAFQNIGSVKPSKTDTLKSLQKEEGSSKISFKET
jgi:hypothetical protein